MTNTSASGGYLVPSSPPIVEDDGLDDFLTGIISSITSITPNLVRPRWQAIAPKMPEADVDWCAAGITTYHDGPARGAILHRPAGLGTDELQVHEEFDLLCSFYGPNSRANAILLRDGLLIPQNREVMQLAQYALIDTGGLTFVPELISNTWFRRTDIRVSLRHAITRVYPVENLLKATGTINEDDGSTEPFDTANKR